MDATRATSTNVTSGCFDSLEIVTTNLQQFRELCEKELNKSHVSGVDTASDLIWKLQTTVTKRFADLNQAKNALHLAQHQVSLIQSEIQSIEASIKQQRIDQVNRIQLAKARLLQIYDPEGDVSDVMMTSTVSSDGIGSLQRDNVVSLTNDICGDSSLLNGKSFSPSHTTFFQDKDSVAPAVGPVVWEHPIDVPVGPVRGRYRQLDKVQNEDSILNQDNSEQDKCVQILEVNPEGKYVKLRNSSRNQVYSLGQCRLQQEIAGHPVAIFRFLPETTLLSLDTLTVWAEGSLSSVEPTEPTDLIFRGLQKWGAGPHFTTIFFDQKGQVLSRWRAVHRVSATTPFQSTNQVQRPPVGSKLRAGSATHSTFSKSPKVEEAVKVFGPQPLLAKTHSICKGGISTLQRPYSAASLPSHLRKV